MDGCLGDIEVVVVRPNTKSEIQWLKCMCSVKVVEEQNGPKFICPLNTARMLSIHYEHLRNILQVCV